MPAPQQGYSIAQAALALTTTAKTLLNLVAGAACPLVIVSFEVSIDGAGNVLIELCESTQAGAGTSTDVTTSIKQVRGFSASDTTAPAQTTVKANYSAEPTVLTRLKAWRFAGPGPLVIQMPLGREVQSLLSGSTKYKALAFRATMQAGTANADIGVEWEE